MNCKKIGAFIQERRIDAKITQEELAKKMHVSSTTIDKWEKGKVLPNIKKLEKQIDNQPKISIEKIEEYFINLQKTFYQATINEKRELLKTFISNISLNNNEHQVEVSLFPQWCTIVEQVVGIEPT